MNNYEVMNLVLITRWIHILKKLKNIVHKKLSGDKIHEYKKKKKENY